MDVMLSNHGSICTARPLTPAAEEWIAENVGSEAFWFGGALCIKHRYVDNIIDGMLNAGLEIE